jgi:hypothetical protein
VGISIEVESSFTMVGIEDVDDTAAALAVGVEVDWFDDDGGGGDNASLFD